MDMIIAAWPSKEEN